MQQPCDCPVMSQANACSKCMQQPCCRMSQADACSYCMGYVVSISSWIYLYSSYFGLDIFLIHRHLIKLDWLMTCTSWLVIYVSSVSGHSINIGSLSGHMCWLGLPAFLAQLPCWSGFLWANLPWAISLDIYGWCLQLVLAIAEGDFLWSNMPGAMYFP